MKPLISIVLPVYNRPTVINTINSVLNQTYSNFELIIVDNASTDSTVSEIRKINDERIKLYINEVNKGQTFSLNRGLVLANGKYIARIDSDDLMYPTRIEDQVTFLESNESYVICGSCITLISDDDKEKGVLPYCIEDNNIKFISTFLCPFAHPAVMFRRDIIEKNSIKYDESLRMAEDYDMWVRILKFGKGLNIAKPLVYYREGTNNDSYKYHMDMKRETFAVMEYVAQNCNWSSYSQEEYIRLIKIAREENKNLYKIIKCYVMWNQYFNENVKKDNVEYHVMRKLFRRFINQICFLDNDSMFAKCVHGIHKQNIRRREAKLK